MRKLLIPLLLLAVATVNAIPEASAQELRRDELLFSIAIPADGIITDDEYMWNPDLYYNYEPRFQNTMFTALWAVEYHHFFTDRFKVGASVNYHLLTSDYYHPVQDQVIGTRYSNIVYLLAHAKYCYIHKEKWQLYSGVGAGAILRLDTMKGTSASFKPGFGYEVVMLGVEYGKKVPVYLETVGGNTAISYRFGIGYRF